MAHAVERSTVNNYMVKDWEDAASEEEYFRATGY